MILFCICCTIIACTIGVTIIRERAIRSWSQLLLYLMTSIGGIVSGFWLIRGLY